MQKAGEQGGWGPLLLGCGQSSLAFLSVFSSYIPFCLSSTKVLSQTSFSCLPCHLPWPALPFWPCGSSLDLCLCACVWFMHPAVPIISSPVSMSAPASAHCVQLQVLLPGSLVTLWPSLMNKIVAPMGEDQQHFKHLRSLLLRHLKVLPSLPLTSKLLRSDGEGQKADGLATLPHNLA